MLTAPPPKFPGARDVLGRVHRTLTREVVVTTNLAGKDSERHPGPELVLDRAAS